MALNDLRESVSIYLSHAWGLFFRLGFYDHRNWILGDKPRTLSRWPLFDAILILSIPSCHLKKKKKEDHLFRDTFILFSLFLFINLFVRFIPICTRIETKRRKLSVAMDTYLILKLNRNYSTHLFDKCLAYNYSIACIHHIHQGIEQKKKNQFVTNESRVVCQVFKRSA